MSKEQILIDPSFLQAPDSQSSLSITWDMFAHLLTFLQAMPELLDFAFQFGHTIQPRDTHFSGFRSRAFLNHSDKGLQLPAFGRSGLGFQQCYNLKSVEPYPGRPSHPWSIRATAIYHSFDVASGSITWVTIKGSALIKHRLTDAVQQSHVKSTSPTAQSFALSLLGHLVMCEWANEHWRSYINSLDDKLHDISKPILNARVARDPPNQGPDIRVWRQVRRTTNMLFDDSTSPNRIRSFLKRALANRNTLPEDKQNSRDMQALPDESRPRNTSRPEARFEFKDVQKLAVIEERAAEARRVLRCNVDTLKALQNMYQTIWEHKNFPHEIKAESEAAMDSFHTRTASTVEDMNRHSLNLDNILHVLEVRRNVVSQPVCPFSPVSSLTNHQLTNMFTHQSIHESQQQARKAQETADNMQDMTQIMGRIARRTEQETVVMKIITVVTLCFLPATFICVSNVLWSQRAGKLMLNNAADIPEHRCHPVFRQQ